MSDGERSPLAKNKNYYLYKDAKKKHPLLQLFTNSLIKKGPKIKEEPKNASTFKFISRNSILNNTTNNNDDNIMNKINNINIPTTPQKIEERQPKTFMTNPIAEKILTGSIEKKKTNNLISNFQVRRTSSTQKIKPSIKYNDMNTSNNLYKSKLAQSVNKLVKHNRIISFQNYDYNNSIFISQSNPVKVKSFSGFGADKEIFQKTVSLDILTQPSVDNNNQNQKIPNINHPYFLEKSNSINLGLTRRDGRKKKKRLYPFLNIFNISTGKLNLNNERKKSLDNANNELSQKLSINLSSDNNSISNNEIINTNYNNYKTNKNINSTCKPTIINDNTINNKSEYINNNIFSINNYSIGNFKKFGKRNSIQTAIKRRSSTLLEDEESQKLKRKLQKKYSVERVVGKKNFFIGTKKASFEGRNNEDNKLKDYRKKAAMSLKNNIQFFNRLTGNKKLSDEYKNKDKIALFRNNKLLKKDEQIKKEETSSEKNSDNKENNNNNSKNSSSEKENSAKTPSSDESVYSTRKNTKIHTTLKSNKSDNRANKKNVKKLNLNNSINESDDRTSSKLYSKEEGEKNESSENSMKEDLKEKDIKKLKLMKDKYWNPKYDDEEGFYKKKLSKITSQLNKINKESYVFNTCKKEIKNNFLQNTVIEKLTTKIINTFGLLFLDEEKADETMQKKLLQIDKNKTSKKLENEINNVYLLHMIKIFKSLYTKNIVIKYNFCLLRVQEKLSIYESHLLKQMDNSWNEINSSYDYIMEMVNYISYNKELTNYKQVNHNKARRSVFVNNENNNFSIKPIKRRDKILKTDRFFFKHLEEIQKELYFKTSFLYLRINLLDLELHDSTEKLNTKIILKVKPNKKRRCKTIKCELSESKKLLLKKSHIKTLKYSKTIKNAGKKNSSRTNLESKKHLIFSTGNCLHKDNLCNDLNNSRNLLFRKSKFLTNFNSKKNISSNKLLSAKKMTTQSESEEEYKKDVEEKEKKFKKTENSLNGLNILKNKSIFTKEYMEKGLDVEKKLYEICKMRQKRRDLDKKMKTDTIIIKTSGYDALTKEAALIKTQDIENDLPDVKLFEKFAKMIQERKYNLFEKNVKLEGDKFLRIINRRDLSSGNTLLYFATQNKLLNFMKLLLIKGASPNIQNKFGNTPLHIAYKCNSSLMINLLLQYSANKQIKNFEGLFPWQMSKYVDDLFP